MNSNLVHNVLNVVIGTLGIATGVLLATGCTTLATGALECSKSFVSPQYTAVAIAVLSGLKTAINIARDGLTGLVKSQPPVK